MAEPRIVRDPQVLRAIAHPVRNRILGELEAQGSLRAADVARELGIPANQASFHLRQLAKYGLVTEDAEAARDRRDRVWRLAEGGALTINRDEFEQTPAGRAAFRVLSRSAAARGHQIVDAAFADDRSDGGHRNVSDSTLRLAPDEARQLAAELAEVTSRWAERTRGQRDPERRTYVYYGVIVPHPGMSEVDG